MVSLYTLQVFLIEGLITEEFGDQEISRIIQIRGDQTLEELHHAIFHAYNRWDEHMYEFNLGTDPYDDSARYVLPGMPGGKGILGLVTNTTIDQLGLDKDRSFGYWFDFGDNWLHQINVVSIEDAPRSGKFPRTTKRVGKSPPQYPDFD